MQFDLIPQLILIRNVAGQTNHKHIRSRDDDNSRSCTYIWWRPRPAHLSTSDSRLRRKSLAPPLTMISNACLCASVNPILGGVSKFYKLKTLSRFGKWRWCDATPSILSSKSVYDDVRASPWPDIGWCPITMNLFENNEHSYSVACVVSDNTLRVTCILWDLSFRSHRRNWGDQK